MKIAHLADLHIDSRSLVTLDEQEQCLTAIDPAVDLVVVAGDVFERASNAAERSTFARVLRVWASIAPVVIVRGNHDAAGDIKLFERLRTSHRITVAETLGAVDEAGLRIGCVPWPSRTRALAWAAERGIEALPQEMMRVLLGGFAGAVDLVVGHIEITAAETDEGQPIAGFCDVPLAVADLQETGVAYCALGHIHKPQEWGAVRYAGSPRQTSFGEQAGKGYTLVELGNGGATWEHKALPSPTWHTICGKWHDGDRHLRFDEPDSKADIVRIRYSASETNRAQAMHDARELAQHYERCKLDPRIERAERDQRSDITGARTLQAKLCEYWQQTTKPARAEQLERKLGELQQCD